MLDYPSILGEIILAHGGIISIMRHWIHFVFGLLEARKDGHKGAGGKIAKHSKNKFQCSIAQWYDYSSQLPIIGIRKI